MDLARLYRGLEISQRYGLDTTYYSLLDLLLIEYSDYYFDRVEIDDFERTEGEFLQLRWMNPENIIYYQSNFVTPSADSFREWEGMRPTLDGKWDMLKTNFKKTIFHKSLEEHFIDGVPWEKTIFIKRRFEEVKEGKQKWGSTTEKDVREMCAEVDDLYTSIKVKEFKHETDPKEYTKDVLVNLSRNGSPILISGRHRLSIATLLELEKIPVRIAVEHVNNLE